MKKSIFIVAFATLLSGSLFTSCKSNSEKESDAVENVQDAKEDLNEVKAEANSDALTKANDEEWQTYKTEANTTILANENRIIELKKAIKKPGIAFDAAYEKSITTLEEKNTSLKNKILDYENNKTDWESFKREFSSDMEDLGQAFKNLTVNNKK